MTSLALLEHTATAPPPPFNSNFYFAAATIIPILFLAIAVQGRGYQNLLTILTPLNQQLDRDDSPWYKHVAAIAAVLVVGAIAFLILAYGVLGEIESVIALYRQKTGYNTGSIVLTGVIILIIATATGPTLMFLRYYFQSFFFEGFFPNFQVAPHDHADTSPDDKPEPETGKPDSA